MSTILYDSFDEFLQFQGTSLVEFMAESELSKNEIYKEHLLPLNNERSSIRLLEYFADEHPLNISDLITSLMIWSETNKGPLFWSKVDAAWEVYSSNLINIDEIRIFSKISSFDINDIKDKVYNPPPSIENI